MAGRPLIRVLIADSETVVRDVIHAAIPAFVGIVAEVADDESALAAALELEPDLILMDLELATSGGIATTHRIKKILPSVHVVLLTAHGEEAFLEATGRSGADALLPKRALRTDVNAVIARLLGKRARV